jgi:WD40 repeat protein/serine/threonine protein kinase
MSESSSERDPVERLADEFLKRFRRGERPALSEYTQKYPQWAERIHKVFPALALMEGIRPEAGDATGPHTSSAHFQEHQLERLGDYRILREVGRGGMGIVYEAEQESLGRHVALKVLPSHALLDARHLKRFQREARAAARLHHTNIVPVYGVGEDGGLHYYVMQFIRGLGLDEVLVEVDRLRQARQDPGKSISRAPSRGRDQEVSVVAHGLLTGQFEARAPELGPAGPPALSPFPSPEAKAVPIPAPHSGTERPVTRDGSVHLPGQTDGSRLSESGRPYWLSVARVGIQVSQALAYAHAQGILHRDIKPSNLLLDTQGNVWVTDFGLAKLADSEDLTHNGDIVGTVRYLAPERFQGKADARSDLYALGLTLYELLTLRSAFDERDRNKLIAQVMHADPPRPRQISPAVPRDLETIVLKALERDPQRRYQTAMELADDLQRFVEDKPIRARRVSEWQRLVLWARRRPAVAGLLVVGAVAALALVGAGVALFFNARLADAFDATERARQDTDAALKKAKFYQYFHHIALAHAGWREGNLVGVDKLLDECPRSQRNWEWHYLKRLCHAHTTVFEGPPIMGLAFSPDGQRLACGAFDGTVRVLDAATGEQISSLRGHTHETADVAFSPDGRRLAASYFDGTIKVWEVTSGREVFTCRGHTETVWQVAFSSDGTRLASVSWDRTVRLWDARTGQMRAVLDHSDWVWGVAFSPDGRQIVSGGQDKAVRLWEVATGRLLRTFERSAPGVYSPVAFSPDGRRLATADGKGNVEVWDAATGLLKHRFSGHRVGVWSITFSPNGQWLASAGTDQTVRTWDVASGQQLLTLKGHTMEVCRVAFHPDGSWLASSSADGTVRAWPATIGQEASVPQSHGDMVGGLAYKPADGARLASTAGDRTVTIWDVETGQVMGTLPYRLLGPPSPLSIPGEHVPVVYSPDGSRIAAGGPDGTIPVWDTRTEQLLRQPRLHSHGVSALAYSPDGSWIASSAGQDKTVLVWEAATGRIVHELPGHTEPITGLAFSPDGGRLASASMDKTVRLWDATTGKALDPPLRGHESWVCGVAFSPDGTHLASAGNDDVVIVWEPATGRQVVKLKHATTVFLAVFSPDGKRLASCSSDIKIWEVATGLETLTLRGHTSEVTWLSFSPDGTRLASGGPDGNIRVWDARPWTEAAAVDAPLEREALGRLDFLFSKPLRKADVRDYLRDTLGISPRARQMTLALVDRYHEETDPERYHQASWAVVSQRYLNAFQYRFALRQAETACHLARGHAKYQTTLGVAQYRNGQYSEALASLTKAEQLAQATAAGMALPATPCLPALISLRQADQYRPVIVANLAFLAMTQHRLGLVEPAHASLARLREATKLSPSPWDQGTQGFLQEAETLIGNGAKT